MNAAERLGIVSGILANPTGHSAMPRHVPHVPVAKGHVRRVLYKASFGPS